MKALKSLILCSGVLLTISSQAGPSKDWHNPVTLDDAVSSLDPNAPTEHQGAYEPNVAVDQRGMAVLAYSQYVVTKQWMYNGFPQVEKEARIFVRTRCNNQWSAPPIGNPFGDFISLEGYNAYQPQVAVNKFGRAIIAWTQVVAGIERIYISMGTKNSDSCAWTWSKPGKFWDSISLNSSANAQRPRVAMDDDGNAIVTWQQRVFKGNECFMNIFASRYDVASDSWEYTQKLQKLEDALNQYGTEAYWPEVTMAKKGGAATISWYQMDPHPGVEISRVFSADFDTATKTWIKPESFQTYISPYQTSATWSSTAMNPKGEGVSVWTQENENGFKQVYVADRSTYLHSWKVPDWNETLSADGTHCCVSGYYDPISVKMNGSGRVAVSWSQNTDSNFFNSQIFVAIRDQGKWKKPGLTEYISDSSPGNADSADIAMNDTGRTLVAWQQQEGSGFSSVFYREYLLKNGVWGWNAVQSASPNSMGFYTGSPSTTMNEKGDAFIAWSQEWNDTYRVYLSQYY